MALQKTSVSTSSEDSELSRLRRIEANYERDKAKLKGRQGVFAGSESRNIGRADSGGNPAREPDRTSMERVSRGFERLIKEALHERI